MPSRVGWRSVVYVTPYSIHAGRKWAKSPDLLVKAGFLRAPIRKLGIWVNLSGRQSALPRGERKNHNDLRIFYQKFSQALWHLLVPTPRTRRQEEGTSGSFENPVRPPEASNFSFSGMCPSNFCCKNDPLTMRGSIASADRKSVV